MLLGQLAEFSSQPSFGQYGAEAFDCLIESASAEAQAALARALHFIGDPFLFQDAAQRLGYLVAGFQAEEFLVIFHLSGCSVIEFSEEKFLPALERVRHRIEVGHDAISAERLERGLLLKPCH